MKKFRISAILIFLSFVLSISAQDTTGTRLHLIAKNDGESIVLRWAPATPGAWAMSLKKGYKIERAEMDTGENFDPELFQPLTDYPVMPWLLEDWEKIAGGEDGDHYSAIAAQAIYGESFMASGAIGENNWLAKSDEFSNRHSVCLLACDMSEKAAKASGLRWVDRKIEPGKTYVYRVYSLVDSRKYFIDTAYTVIGGDEIWRDPEIKIDVAEIEGGVKLRWDRAIYDQFYTAFYIERSIDGVSFEKLNEWPYVSSPKNDNPETFPSQIFVDTTVQNYQKHYYRIYGINSFGESGPKSNIVEGMGRDKTPPSAPVNVKAEHLGGNEIRVSWEVLPGEMDIDGFIVAHSTEVLEQFQPLHEKPLPGSNRSYIDITANPNSTNYYVVAAMDTAGNAAVSLSAYGMVLDSLPPARPLGLTGEVDSSGHVHLSWDLGPEADIIGYQVYFANAANHVFTQVTNRPWKDTTYTDTISLNTLTRKVYYSIIAVDANYNYSKFSDTLELTRPDTIPPGPPVLSDYVVEKDHIEIKWAPSSSSDASGHRLYRRSEYTNWRLIADMNNDTRTYKDSLIEKGEVYYYRVEAIDDSGLSSGFVHSLRVAAIDFALKPPVQKMLVKAQKGNDPSFDIQWTYPFNGNYKFIVYKSENGGPFKTFKKYINDKSITDKSITSGNQYEYAVKVVYSDGKQSSFVQSEVLIAGQ